MTAEISVSAGRCQGFVGVSDTSRAQPAVSQCSASGFLVPAAKPFELLSCPSGVLF